MNKLLLTATAMALVVGYAANSYAENNTKTGVGAAISNTAGAAYQKSAQGVNAVKGTYHQNMAEMNAEAAKENLAKGDLQGAATDAKDAAEHQSMAMDAKAKADASKQKASKDWSKAKSAVNPSPTTN